MKNYLLIAILSLMVFTYSCSDQKGEKYVIIDSQIKGDMKQYLVYTPDTNWMDMRNFAESLIQDKNKRCAVGFFHPKSKTPSFYEGEFFFPPEAYDFLIANYSYNEKVDEFVLEIVDDHLDVFEKYKNDEKIHH